MNREVIKSINGKVYRRFPEVKGKAPKIQEQRKSAKASDSSSTYLLIYSSQIKTSGKKGLHVLIPIKPKQSFKLTKKFVHETGIQLAKQNPNVVSELSDTKKPGKIFVDYLQNSLGRTIASPYSLRATPNALVSTPLEWSEIKKGIKPSNFNIYTIIKREKTPWKDILKNKQEF